MSDHNAEAKLEAIAGMKAEATVIRGAEAWQFFAFVFAATVAVALALIEEVGHPALRIGLKLVAFVGLAYAILLNSTVRNFLVGVLSAFKTEGAR